MQINDWHGKLLPTVFVTTLASVSTTCTKVRSEAESPIHRLGSSEFRLNHAPGGRHFRFSPDGRMIVGANWGEVKLWTFPEGKLIRDFADVVSSVSAGFAKNGNELLVFDRNARTIYRFALPTGELRTKIELQEEGKKKGYPNFHFSSDGRWLCGVGWLVSVWDTRTGKRQLGPITPRFNSVRAPISNKGVLSLWDHRFLVRYDVLTGQQLSKTNHGGRLDGLISDQEGMLFAAYSSEDEAVVFWEPSSGSLVDGIIPMSQHGWSEKEATISNDQSLPANGFKNYVRSVVW